MCQPVCGTSKEVRALGVIGEKPYFSSLFSLWRSLKVEKERLGTRSAKILLLTFSRGRLHRFSEGLWD